MGSSDDPSSHPGCIDNSSLLEGKTNYQYLFFCYEFNFIFYMQRSLHTALAPGAEYSPRAIP